MSCTRSYIALFSFWCVSSCFLVYDVCGAVFPSLGLLWTRERRFSHCFCQGLNLQILIMNLALLAKKRSWYTQADLHFKKMHVVNDSLHHPLKSVHGRKKATCIYPPTPTLPQNRVKSHAAAYDCSRRCPMQAIEPTDLAFTVEAGVIRSWSGDFSQVINSAARRHWPEKGEWEKKKTVAMLWHSGTILKTQNNTQKRHIADLLIHYNISHWSTDDSVSSKHSKTKTTVGHCSLGFRMLAPDRFLTKVWHRFCEENLSFYVTNKSNLFNTRVRI